jgi:Domain of unknown function (DUF397)
VASLPRQENLTWRKSTASGGTNCVEIASSETMIHVRDSKNPGGPMLSFTRGAWLTFLAASRNGAFKLAEHGAGEIRA